MQIAAPGFLQSPESGSETARDIIGFCAPHQMVLLNLLATSQLYDVPIEPLIRGLEKELPLIFRSRVKKIADSIAAGEDPLETIVASRLLPETTATVLFSARKGNKLNDFYAAVLESNQDDRDEVEISDHPFFKVARLILLLWFMAAMLTFICLKIVPEFKAMTEEFGIDLPGAMWLFISVCDTVVRYWFVLPAVLLLLTPWYFPSVLSGFKYLNPLNWRRVWDDPLKNQNRMDAAMMEFGVQPALAADSSGPFDDTQAWLVRWKDARTKKRSKDRSSFLLQFLITLTYTIIAIMVFLAASAIFSTLLKIILGLTAENQLRS